MSKSPLLDQQTTEQNSVGKSLLMVLRFHNTVNVKLIEIHKEINRISIATLNIWWISYFDLKHYKEFSGKRYSAQMIKPGKECRSENGL